MKRALSLAICFSFFFMVTASNYGIAQASSTKLNHTRAEIEFLEKYIEQFHADNGSYPSTSEGLEALQNQPPEMLKWRGPYIKKAIPIDPWGNPYAYNYPPKYGTKTFDLYSFGRNGRDNFGAEDDITNWRPVDSSFYDSNDILRAVAQIIILCLIGIVLFLLWQRRKSRERKR